MVVVEPSFYTVCGQTIKEPTNQRLQIIFVKNTVSTFHTTRLSNQPFRMARHDREDDNDRKSRKHHETTEERLLRKAKEFVEREEHKTNRDDEERDRHRRKSTTNDDNSRSRKHRSREDSRDRKRYRKDSRRNDDSDHDRKNHRKSHRSKESKKERNEKSSVKMAKMETTRLYPLGEIIGTPPLKHLDIETDYFAYHQHLWVYLYREEGIIFGDLTSDEARMAFSRFCQKYNSGKLEQAYYNNRAFPQEALDECKTTRHKWAFQTSEIERKSLHLVEEGVRKQTEYDADNKLAEVRIPTPAKLPSNKEEEGNHNNMTAEERVKEWRANQRLREHVRTAEDELRGGQKDGRERQLEKKQEKATHIHASACDKDTHMSGVELDDSTLYGDNDSGFQQALAREKQRKAQRIDRKSTRLNSSHPSISRMPSSA